jgi:hypothetical protein
MVDTDRVKRNESQTETTKILLVGGANYLDDYIANNGLLILLGTYRFDTLVAGRAAQ